MSRYLMGINSTTFEQGFCRDRHVFDKRRVEGMMRLDRVYLIADSCLVEFGQTALLLWKKRAARHAQILADMHGGIPLVVQCQPQTDRLHPALQVKGGVYQEGSAIRVLKVFRLARCITAQMLEIACVLERIDPLSAPSGRRRRNLEAA